MRVNKYRKAVYDQSTVATPRAPRGSNAAAGVCLELSLKWLKDRLKEIHGGIKRKPDERMGRLGNEARVDKAIQRHNANVSKLDPLVASSRDYKLDKGFSHPFPSLDTVVEQALKKNNGAYAFGFTCPRYDHGKHEIAIFKPSSGLLSNKVQVFDPNEGEFMVDAKKFKKWMETFLQNNYGTPGNPVTPVELVEFKLPQS